MTACLQRLKRLWLIGGTQESAQLARVIAQAGLPCIISVATESARNLYPNLAGLQVQVGRLNAESLPKFLQTAAIAAVLDASHPYAVEISQLAIRMAAQLQIPYLRYERPMWQQVENYHATTTFDSFEQLLAGNELQGERVLLTVGYQPLRLFCPWQSRATLFARILPSLTALEAALAAGFTSDRLLALRPPITAELEKALWQQWQISMVITKASGQPGGETVKRQVAAELGVKLVAIARPLVAYPQQTSDLTTALEFCQQHLASQSAS